MPTARKVETVDELARLLSENQTEILTEYRGLTVTDLGELRRKLREGGIEFHVVKNTLARIAAAKSNREELVGLLAGPMAIAFCNEETSVAKVLTEYIRTSRKPLEIKGGVIGHRVLTADEVNALATLPTKDELLAKMLGSLQSPITGLVTVLSGNMRGLMTVLNGRISQLEGNA